jgi:hypothetical protein
MLIVVKSVRVEEKRIIRENSKNRGRFLFEMY